ncbi:MAG: hypothetical protein LBH45_02375 [Campylobacteraceae bacterium]|jgi:hypothetical protein|nr:hypothetical protein [Campylobacteraceae bacterium]
MSTLIKPFGIALILAFLIGCGGGGDGSNTYTFIDDGTDDAQSILSDYLAEIFPPFDNSLYVRDVIKFHKAVEYIGVSRAAAGNFNASMYSRGFRVDSVYGKGSPNCSYYFLGASLEEYKGFDLCQDGNSWRIGLNLVSRSFQSNIDFNNAFGRPSDGTIHAEEVTIEYGNVVDSMLSKFENYFGKLGSRGKFERGECTKGWHGPTSWKCVSGGIHSGYHWDSYYDESVIEKGHVFFKRVQ